MPEIKHQFTGGKMNKDVDERLVPNGEYRDAMNIQVSTSDGSSVGTIQNVLGNKIIEGQLNISNPATCIGSISDEKNDATYWFTTTSTFESAYRGENPEIFPVNGQNHQGNLFWPSILNGLGGQPQLLLKSNFSTKQRINAIYRYEDSTVTPVFIDEAGVTVTLQSGVVNSAPETQLDLAVAQQFPGSPSTALGFNIGNGLGYNSQSPTSGNGLKFEVYDGGRIRLGDRISMWGVNPWTSESVNFLEGYHEKYGGVTVMDKQVVGTWIHSDGTSREHCILTLSEDIYLLTWWQDDLMVKNFFTSNGWQIKLDQLTTHIVFQQSILGFNPETLITGINILDDMLFWTDNNTEPKKINISRSIQGTNPSGLVHTKLINKATGVDIYSGIDTLEEHITVIRKSPTTPLSVTLNTDRDEDKNYSGIVTIDDGVAPNVSSYVSSSLSAGLYDFSSLEVGDVIKMEVVSDVLLNTAFDLEWEEGTKVVLTEDVGTGVSQLPVTSFAIKGVIDTWVGNNFDSAIGPVRVQIKISSIAGNPPVAGVGGFLHYVIDRFDESQKLFEFKFPRFSYRYKYEDNEYSSYGPFTEPAFMPGALDYHPKKGYNVGMTNRVTNIDLMDYIANDIPLDVVQVDLLYKEDSSPNIYVIDTLKPQDDILVGNVSNFWDKNSYNLTNETIYAVVAENQLLRPWDNVPRKALAQEVTGNRIVYGNYLQNYDLTIGALNTLKNFYPEFKSSIVNDKYDNTSKKSIKALREYQLGVVFSDEYGRETPVLSNPTGAFRLEKEMASGANKLKVGFRGQLTPDNLRYYKFFIKETSSEYYNIAMDRFYDAEDRNFWIAFPSTDRNKIDIDTFLILKKGPDSNSLVTDEARYKIIAIEDEAPEFIRTTRLNIGRLVHDLAASTPTDIFGSTFDGCPGLGRTSFTMDADPFQGSSLKNIANIKDPIYVEFGNLSSGTTSDRYRISTVSTQDPYVSGTSTYEFSLEKQFGTDVNFISNDPSGNMPTEVNDQTTITFYKYVVESKPQFDGRFFVKIYADDAFDGAMTTLSATTEYRILDEKKIYLLSANHKGVHTQANSMVFGDGNPLNPSDGIGCNCTHNSHAIECHNWKYYTAYFTGDQVANSGAAQSFSCDGNTYYGQWNTLKARGADWDDVWFIDEGFSTATHGSDNKYDFGRAGNPNNNNTNTSGVGIHDYPLASIPQSQIDLSFGPIVPSGINVSGGTYGTGYNNLGQAVAIEGGYHDNFWPGTDMWDLQSSNMAHYHHLTPWIEKMVSGSRFKWQEDPTGTIYTIFDATTEYNRVNYEPNSWVEGWVAAHERPENFRKNYRFKCTPSHSSWNPTVAGIGDAIAGSIVVDSYVLDPTNTAVITPLTTAAASVGFTVKVPSLQFWTSYSGTQTVGPTYNKRWPIARGMILTKYGTSGSYTSLSPGVLVDDFSDDGTNVTITFVGYENTTVNLSISQNDELVFKQPIFNGLSENSAKNINDYNAPTSTSNGMAAVGYTLQFVEDIIAESILPDDPAIWETEPKDSSDLDIYHEISGRNPLRLDKKTIKTAIPIGSRVTCNNGGGSADLHVIDNISNNGNKIQLSENLCIFPAVCATGTAGIEDGDIFHIIKPDGSYFGVEVSDIYGLDTFRLKSDLYNSNYHLNWHNCYSFGNGVESNRIRDNFNLPFISNGVKVSSRSESRYEEERREYGLIYSGIYNSVSGVNNLNQFIQAEKITKDVNPIYGSIQKLHSRSTADGDLITLCEDRVLKILANKDALYNANGNTQLTATENVLGQAIPFSGDHGISKNPESFASEAYRVYFTDKVRGTVMRLSKDGLTPISDHGMKDWFRDNLKLSNRLIGSYDDKKDEYNITLIDRKFNTPNGTTYKPKTVSFREDVKGWVSFKSFIPENGISCANEYYTLKNGRLWQHNVEQIDQWMVEFGRNTFYGKFDKSLFNVILNDVPGSVKSFNTINYEGSQSKVKRFLIDASTGLTDGNYHNLTNKKGWHVSSIFTNKESGTIDEFIEKEGKWFNYIKGEDIQLAGQYLQVGSSTFDQASLAVQGLGILKVNPILTPISGCTDSTASNYYPFATIDDGSCVAFVLGCMEPDAYNWHATATQDDGVTCVWSGCTVNNGTMVNPTPFSATAYTYNSGNNIIDDGSCVPWVFGCTDSTATNYNPLANSDDGSCILFAYGCMLPNTDNYDSAANTDDGSCTWLGCTNTLASNYGWSGWGNSGFPSSSILYVPTASTYGIQDNGSCIGNGCMDITASNYDPLALYDQLNLSAPDYSSTNGSCIWCDWSSGGGAYSGTPIVVTSAGETSLGASNGQVAVEWDTYGPYLSYTFELEDGNGNVYTTYALGQQLGGFPSTNSVLFYNLPAGTYTATVIGGGTASACSYSVGGNIVGTTPIVIYGCQDSAACNYDSSATVQLSGNCDYTTCAGCMGVGATNIGMNTSNTNPCLQPGTLIAGPCTIECGDGNSATGFGDYCCDYTIYGCTDATACNYLTTPNGQTTVVDDGSCDFSGCMDSSPGLFPNINGVDSLGTPCVWPNCVDNLGSETGYAANNYRPCATIWPLGICDYGTTGCTDSTACNYDPNAQTSDGSCVFGFAGATIGDPATGPIYYYTGSTSNSDTEQHYVASYPLSNSNERDIGLTIQMQPSTMAQYNANSGDKVTVNLYRKQQGPGCGNNGCQWTLQHTHDITPSQVFWQNDPGGAIFGGNRAGSGNNPYPWGPSSTSGSNFVFQPLYLSTVEYAVEVTSTVSGVVYGGAASGVGGATPTCGLWSAFTFTPHTDCFNAFAVNGCTDSTACNYDASATCDDGSCYYGTTNPSYEPILPCGSGCQTCGTCNGPACNPSTTNYNSLAACNAACGAS